MLYIDMFMYCSIHWSLVMSCFSSHATWLYKDEWILTYLFIHRTEGTNDQLNQLRSPAEWGPQVFKQLLNKSQACSAGRPAIDGEGIAEVAWNVKAHLVGATCGICKFTSVQQSNSHGILIPFISILYTSILTDSTGCCSLWHSPWTNKGLQHCSLGRNGPHILPGAPPVPGESLPQRPVQSRWLGHLKA
jgi:hypothetical protein